MQPIHYMPHQAAQLADSEPHNIRRWLAYHKDDLRKSANPAKGLKRRLTPRAVEVLRSVKTLPDPGLNVIAIQAQLAG